MTPRQLLRPQVLSARAYRLVEEKGDVKLNQNELPFDYPPELKEEIFERLRLRSWNRYAQQSPQRVVKLLAEENDWPPEGIILGAGSNLLLEVLTFGAVSPGDFVLAPAPCFSLYRLLSGLSGARIREIEFGEAYQYRVSDWLKHITADRPVLTFMCIPNNPTGSFLGKEGVEAVLEASEALVVVDEAYREFAGEDRRDILHDFGNLVLSRTFSKACGGAGIRLGYLLAQPALAAEIRKLVPPFNINILSATAAEVILENRTLTRERVDKICAERERVMERLSRIPRIEVFPSRANFFLLRTELEASELGSQLKERGILVRVLNGPGLEKTVRVNVGTEQENDCFLSGLEQVLAEGKQV